MKTDQFISSFPNRDWVLYNTGYPVFITPHAIAPAQEFAKRYGISNDAVVLGAGTRFDWLFDKKQLDSFAKKHLPAFLKKERQLYDDWKKLADLFAKDHYALMKFDLSRITNRELQELMKRYYASFLTQYTPSNIIEPISYYFQHSLKQLLIKTGVTPKETDRLIIAYGLPAHSSYLKRCAKAVSQARSKKDIDHLLEKYHYINNSYAGERRVTRRDLTRIAKQVSDGASTRRPRVANTKALQLLSLLEVIATIQDVRKEQSLMWVSGVTKFLRELHLRTGIPLKDLLMTTWTECMSVQLPSREQFIARHKQWVITWTKSGEQIYEGAQAKKLFSLFHRHVVGDQRDTKILQGVSASAGKITGRVVVVLNLSDFDKVRKGDILVTMMTRPEFMPVMHLASAFVTDEGGITCHAAIVAREMKKPCIIGTKNATYILKDGDMVEVDAEQGIVRKI